MRSSLRSSFLALCSYAAASSIPTSMPTKTFKPVELAIAPTAPGMIGINPVSVTLSLSYADILYHSLFSDYIEETDNSVIWTAKETNAITEVISTTQSGQAAAITNAVPVAVVASAQDADLQVLMTPELINEFKSIAASTACGKRKRSACGLTSFMDGVLHANGGVIQAADNALPGDRILINPNDVGEVLQTLIGILRAGGTAVPPKMAAGAGVGALAYLFYQLYETNPQEVPNAFVIPASMVATSTVATTTQTGCPPDAPTGINKPMCSDCDGNQDKVCQSGQYKNCNCLEAINPIFQPVNRTLLEEQQSILEAAQTAGTLSTTTSVKCSSTKNSDALNVDISFVQQLATQFCAGDLSKTRSQDMTNKDINSKAYDGYTFHLSYTSGDGGCESKCESAFTQVTATCKGLNSHSIQKSGSTTVSCGASFSYEIHAPAPATSTTQPAPAPAPTGPDGHSTLSNQACEANTNPKSPTFKRSDALNVINQLCKQELKGDKNGCIQVADKGVFAQAWEWESAPGVNSPCQAWPFDMLDESYAYASGFKDMCTWALMSAMDDCDTNTVDKKLGGSNQLQCVNYKIVGQNGKSDYEDQACPWAK